MTRLLPFLAVFALGCGATVAAPPAAASTAAEVGKPAPSFSLQTLDGKPVNLADYKGKKVVLEWFNPGCPFVKQAHNSGGVLEDMAKKTTDKGVVWLAVNSGAPGKQGHGVETNKEAKQQWSIAHPILPDEKGDVGKSYGAKTTPHMYVLDEEQKLVYAGAIDNAPMGRVQGDTRVNYVEQALADLEAGREVQTPRTKSWGCSVKYAD